MLDCITHLICPSVCLEPCLSIAEENGSNDLSGKNFKPIGKESSSFMDQVWCVVQKVEEVASFVIASALSALLFWVNPSLFAFGFFAGIIFDENVETAIQKIKNVWINQKVAGCIFGTFACWISLPVTLATASMLWPAHLGSLLSRHYPSEDEKLQTPPAAESC